MGQQDSVSWLSSEQLDQILGSARRAGSFLIVSRGPCARTIDTLTEQGLVREHRGYIVLTSKGREQRRVSGRVSSEAAL